MSSGLSRISRFTLEDAVTTVASTSVAFFVATWLTPKILSWIQTSNATAQQVVFILILSMGQWLGNIVADAVFGRR